MSGSTFCWSTKQTCIKIHMCSYWVVYLLLNRSLIVEHCSGSNGELPGYDLYIYTFSVHYEKIRIHLREMATNSAKIHSLARKYEHLRINQMQLRFLHFNQHSITLLGIYMRHWAYKREKYTFINANIKVINTILKVNRDNWHTLKCKHYSLIFLWHCTLFAIQ